MSTVPPEVGLARLCRVATAATVLPSMAASRGRCMTGRCPGPAAVPRAAAAATAATADLVHILSHAGQRLPPDMCSDSREKTLSDPFMLCEKDS